MAKSFLILGLGRFGASVSATLYSMGHEVLAIDKSEERVNFIADKSTRAVIADVADEKVLDKFGVRNFDHIIISVGDNIRSSVLATMICRELGAKSITAKAADDLHGNILLKTGADRVILPERDAGVRLAKQLVSGNVIDYLDLSDTYSIKEIRIPKSWVGKTILKVNVRKRYGVSIIALRRNDSIVLTLDPETAFDNDDILILVGDNRDLAKVESLA